MNNNIDTNLYNLENVYDDIQVHNYAKKCKKSLIKSSKSSNTIKTRETNNDQHEIDNLINGIIKKSKIKSNIKNSQNENIQVKIKSVNKMLDECTNSLKMGEYAEVMKKAPNIIEYCNKISNEEIKKYSKNNNNNMNLKSSDAINIPTHLSSGLASKSSIASILLDKQNKNIQKIKISASIDMADALIAKNEIDKAEI